MQVLDVNDNSPTITVRFLLDVVDNQNRVPEDVRVGGGVAVVQVRDKDSGSNAKVSITMYNHESDFTLREISPGQHILEVKQPLSLEKSAQYNLLFTAEDHGVPRKRINQSFVIRLADSNRHAPQFKKPLYRLKVPDDTAPGSFISTPTATDVDNGKNARLTYSLESVQMIGRNTSGLGKAGDWFGFDPQTERLRLMKTLWCVFTPAFLLSMNVQDGGRKPRTAATTMRVTVTCSKNVRNFSVSENLPVGSRVGKIQLTPIVPGKKLSIHVTPQKREDFRIDNETGLVTTTRILNRESVSSYTLQGVISDGELQMGVTLYIRVLDENDNAPVFVDVSDNQLVYIPSDARPGERVYKVRATDADVGKNGKIRYSIEDGNEDDTFSMVQDNGELVVINSFTRPSYVLLLRAADQGDVEKDAFVRIQIKIKVTVAVTIEPTPSGSVGVVNKKAGFFSNTKVIIVVGVCGALALVLLVVLVVILVAKRNRRREEKVVEVVVSPEEKRYSGHEISREEAIKLSKKKYNDATENNFKNPSALQKAKKFSNGEFAPLFQEGKPFMDPPDRRGSPVKDPPSEVFYMGRSKDRINSEDELDSGRGGSTPGSSPHSGRSPIRRPSDPHEWKPSHEYGSGPVKPHVRAHAPHGHRRGQMPRGPVVMLPYHDDPYRRQALVTLADVAHSTTDL